MDRARSMSNAGVEELTLGTSLASNGTSPPFDAIDIVEERCTAASSSSRSSSSSAAAADFTDVQYVADGSNSNIFLTS